VIVITAGYGKMGSARRTIAAEQQGEDTMLLNDAWHSVTSGAQRYGDASTQARVNELIQSSSGHFRIDLEMAPQVIRDLEEARERLDRLDRWATRVGHTRTLDTPGKDKVSVNAAKQISRLAMDPQEGSLYTAIKAYRDAIDGAIEALRKSYAAYRNVEELNTVQARPFEEPSRPNPVGPYPHM